VWLWLCASMQNHGLEMKGLLWLGERPRVEGSKEPGVKANKE
jgi:hypothetical protein